MKGMNGAAKLAAGDGIALTLLVMSWGFDLGRNSIGICFFATCCFLCYVLLRKVFRDTE